MLKMAHLLGNRYCIESLRNDVTDLQGAVIDVLSRVGPVRFPSWKYPDKISCDLDMTDLLERHDYCEDEEERQVAHIVLLELVIDRLMLLMQSMCKYTDQVISRGRAGSSPQVSSPTSIGLVVKKYWNKMIQIAALTQQLQTENKNKTQSVLDLEQTLSRVSDSNESSNSQIRIPLNDSDAACLNGGKISRPASYNISRDECIKSTQTVETAFVPCESCDLAQKHLREVGSVVVDVCTTQDLPSSLARHRKLVEQLDWMSGTDIARWATEQNKDLVRINKHLSQLHSTIEPLRVEVEKTAENNNKLQKKVAECTKQVQMERETQSVQQKQYENKLKVFEAKSRDEMTKVERQKEALQRARDQLQEQTETLRNQLKKQEDTIADLELAKENIISDMETRLADNEHVRRLETDLDNTQHKLLSIQEQLNSAKKDLTRERAKSKSVSQHTELLQGKQEDLVQRLDMLDQDNEELRVQVAQLEEQQEQLEGQLQQIKDEKSELKQQLSEEKKLLRKITVEKEKLERITEELRSEILQMEQQVQEAQEHERLLVDYPDLNGPVNPDLTGTGDILVDMENQVRANSLRIGILEEQNTKLRNSITKMMASHKQMSRQPVALWNVQSSVVQDNQYRDLDSAGNRNVKNVPSSSSHTRTLPVETGRAENATCESFVIGKGPKSGRSRPPSGKLEKGCIPQSNTTINTYKQLRKAGLIKVNQLRPPSAKPKSPDGSHYEPAETFSCARCDKMYNSAHDLNIHRLYCFGPS